MRPVQAVPRVRVEGLDFGDHLYLADLRIVQRLNAPSQCEMSWKATTLDSQVLEQMAVTLGQQVIVRIDGQSTAALEGEVTGIEHVHQPSGGLTVRIRAYDGLVRLQRRQCMDTHVDVTTAELVRTLASRAGLAVETEADGPVWPRVVPRYAHDLALMRAYVARSGLHLAMVGNTLRLFAPREGDPALERTLGETLFEARVERNAVQPVGSVRVLGWDPHTGEPRQAQMGEGAAVTPGDLNAERTLLGAAVESDGEAEALAAAELGRCRATSGVLWAVAEGDVSLRPGRWLRVRGVASGLEGPYLLSTVVHTVDERSGYVCELSSRPEPLERPSPDDGVPSLLVGEVCDVEDPEDRGRVQVTLDSYAEAVSTWMLVMQLGAGQDKGVITLPEVGDHVLVGLPDGDPSRGVVLGGVYRREGPPHDPDASRSSGVHRPFTLKTRGGQRIRLNDADGSIRMENAAGSYLALTEAGLTLHAVGELVIEAPGERVILGGDRIDLERR